MSLFALFFIIILSPNPHNPCYTVPVRSRLKTPFSDEIRARV